MAAKQRMIVVVGARPPSLIDIAKSVKPKVPPTWFDKITPEQREQILFVCKELIAGRMQGSQMAIARAWAEAGIPITKTGMSELMRKIRSGAVQ